MIDHQRHTVTVIQRNLAHERSRLSVGWVDLQTGRSGITGLPDAVPGTYSGYPTTDRAGTLPTGPGPVVLIVYGQIPGWVGLIPAAPEYFGIFTPAPALLPV